MYQFRYNWWGSDAYRITAKERPLFTRCSKARERNLFTSSSTIAGKMVYINSKFAFVLNSKGLTYVCAFCPVGVNVPRSTLLGVLTVRKRVSAKPAVTEARIPSCREGKNKMLVTKNWQTTLSVLVNKKCTIFFSTKRYIIILWNTFFKNIK